MIRRTIVERFTVSMKWRAALPLCFDAIPDGKPFHTFPGIALAVALGLQAAAAAAQTTTPTPAPAPAQPAPGTSAPATAKLGITLAKFEARREKAFMGADTDGDGKVSLAEWTAFQTQRKAKSDPAKSFARMDANKDGFVDKSELDAFLAKRFARLDKNGDGMLGADERPGHKTWSSGRSSLIHVNASTAAKV